MKYYLEVLDAITQNDMTSMLMKTKEEFSTKAKAMTALEKKEINTNQQKRIHLCTHDELKNSPCEIIN